HQIAAMEQDSFLRGTIRLIRVEIVEGEGGSACHNGAEGNKEKEKAMGDDD
ncbi:hypothetical protein A2U01_0048108, partial [Trifolium medium]|nr:hypothetical protein [Trifolium medium]